MIRIISHTPGGAVPDTVEAFLHDLGGPAWIEVRGRDTTRTRAVATLIHGNEPSGVRAIHGWLRDGAIPAVDVRILIASIDAALAPPGFAHRMLPGRQDLNRCFLPPFEGEGGALAREALERLRVAAPEALVDLHNNTGHNPPYGVGPATTPTLLSLTALFGKHFVHSDLRLGALVEATQHDFPSVTIECGRAGDAAADAVARAGLDHFLGEAHVVDYAGSGAAMEVLERPVRVSVSAGTSVAFAEGRQPGVDLTVTGDVDRHNFERVAAGTHIGWVREGTWPLEARDAAGRDRSRELFVIRDGFLEARRDFIPIMMTTDATVALADCLFYVVRRASSS